jgi:hypothetical protein
MNSIHNSCNEECSSDVDKIKCARDKLLADPVIQNSRDSDLVDLHYAYTIVMVEKANEREITENEAQIKENEMMVRMATVIQKRDGMTSPRNLSADYSIMLQSRYNQSSRSYEVDVGQGAITCTQTGITWSCR